MKMKTLYLAIAIAIASPLAYAANSGINTTDTYLKGEIAKGEVAKDKDRTVRTFKVDGHKDKDGNDIDSNAGETVYIEGKGKITVNTNGTYTFDPDRNYFGAVPIITYTLDDGTKSTLEVVIAPESLKEYDSPIDSTAINNAASGTQSEAQVSRTNDLVANINAAEEQGKISHAKANAWRAAIIAAGIPVLMPASPS